ncbi:unnamed protein product [Chondrus crispus]|uniref:Uncharacterized protein n=1 Tax=Chondrus crispus TaxID=2769 RepID=R7Q817_CHOCR|nr:unnamed protein product [Chondrus crispus]CDF33620.1 unnamed protein product [Chondrus crispus]|eukprot:XP_005713423.1 unnamed protein product [Chondrus crispus]
MEFGEICMSFPVVFRNVWKRSLSEQP